MVDSGSNFSLHQTTGGFINKPSVAGDDGLFSQQDTPSSSISPFSPSLTDDFPGLDSAFRNTEIIIGAHLSTHYSVVVAELETCLYMVC